MLKLKAKAPIKQVIIAVHRHLADFERPGGVAMSDTASGVQWDLPYGWAPTTWIAVAGLEKSGFHDDAARIARKFSATIVDKRPERGDRSSCFPDNRIPRTCSSVSVS